MADDKKDSKATAVAAPAAPVISPEIEVEFGDERNRQFAWGPGGQIMLRGAWSKVNLRSDELVEFIATMPNIPGQRVRVCYGRKMAVIYDPLALEKNREECEKLQAIIEKCWGRKEGPVKEVVKQDMDSDDLKTWLYWMRRFVDNGKARVITGDLPTIRDIQALPGRTRMSMYDNSSRACRWQEEYDTFTDSILNLLKAARTAI